MSRRAGELPRTLTPTADETRLAQESCERLARLVAEQSGPSIRCLVQRGNAQEEAVPIPAAALRLLSDILSQMAQGNAVSVVPIDTEVTTQQGADLLNVSRPFLIEQLEGGVIPFRKVGTHRRIRLRDLLSYKQAVDQKRLQALEELSAQAQALGMGY